MRENVELKVFKNYFNYAQFLSTLNGQTIAKTVELSYDDAITRHPDETDEDTLRDFCLEYLKEQIIIEMV